jgi:hypothetical protein
MDRAKVIRVEIDPYSITADEDANAAQGFLHEELEEFRQALAQDGGLSMFQLPEWFRRTKTAVVKNVPPASEESEFHKQVQADLKSMLQLLESMATMMAAWKPPETSAKTAASSARVGNRDDEEVFYLIQSQ